MTADIVVAVVAAVGMLFTAGGVLALAARGRRQLH
ncbi:hypothetical protein CLV43_1011030 [Umezawaea tangerina]|uniref:Uncharacterized protein n=1 Tax=Umezawaea tangerina TaxID=84725 RepID=A0A2T0TM08_9PSEU|nr:hypothetical protein CLV43_1011030 [Umezawaea tangerina]